MLRIRLVHVLQLGLAAEKIRLTLSKDQVSEFATVVPHKAADFVQISDLIVVETIPFHATELFLMEEKD